MNVLITGPTSFVGRHLLPLLEAQRYDLYHLVREQKGFQREFLWDFTGPLPDSLPACDVVVHLAAYVDFTPEMKTAQYLVNTVSTARLARYCQITHAYMIKSSMTGIHGISGYISKSSPIIPANHYGMSKYLAEEIVRIFAAEGAILRICGIYGLDGPFHLGLNKAISEALHQKTPPTLVGPGQGRRNYICVKDVAHWILKLIRNRKKRRDRSVKQGVETLYFAGPETMTIEQYLRTIIEILLPGEKIVREKGIDGADCVVEAPAPPFSLTLFREYLTELKDAL